MIFYVRNEVDHMMLLGMIEHLSRDNRKPDGTFINRYMVRIEPLEETIEQQINETNTG